MKVTTKCIYCESLNGYFNGNQFECLDCKSQWDGNVKLSYKTIANTFDDSRELFLKLENIIVSKFTNEDRIRKLFSLSWNEYKSLFVGCDPVEPELEYLFNIELCLLNTKDYNQMLKIKAGSEISQSSIDEMQKGVIKSFLDTRDEFKLYPDNKELANYINAPIELIESIYDKVSVNVKFFLPDPDECDFSILFSEKIKFEFNQLKKNKDVLNDGYFNLEIMKEELSNIISGNNFPPYQNPYLFLKLQEHFSNEIKQVRQYHKDYSSWNSHIQSAIFNENELDNITRIDFITKVINHYFF